MDGKMVWPNSKNHKTPQLPFMRQQIKFKVQTRWKESQHQKHHSHSSLVIPSPTQSSSIFEQRQELGRFHFRVNNYDCSGGNWALSSARWYFFLSYILRMTVLEKVQKWCVFLFFICSSEKKCTVYRGVLEQRSICNLEYFRVIKELTPECVDDVYSQSILWKATYTHVETSPLF
jgi:hypothetical protein